MSYPKFPKWCNIIASQRISSGYWIKLHSIGLKLNLFHGMSTCHLICHWENQGVAAVVVGNRGHGLEKQIEIGQNRGLSSSPPQGQEHNYTLILLFHTFSSFVQYFLRGEWAVALKLCEGASVCQKSLPKAVLSPCWAPSHPMVPTRQEHLWWCFYTGTGNI